jgi:four helix bundle protein
MSVIRSFQDLEVWQKAMDLAEACYAAARAMPQDERYVLGAELRRAAISVPSNVAEGHRLTRRQFRRHLRIALASTAEVETQIELARRLNLVSLQSVTPVVRLVGEVTRLAQGLLRALPIAPRPRRAVRPGP